MSLADEWAGLNGRVGVPERIVGVVELFRGWKRVGLLGEI